MNSGEPPASSSLGNAGEEEEEDDFYWDAEAEAELQAIEAAYAAAKRRRLPDWPSLNPVTASASASASGGCSPAPPWAPSPPAFRGALLGFPPFFDMI